MVKATQPLTRRLTQPVDAALSAFTNLGTASSFPYAPAIDQPIITSGANTPTFSTQTQHTLKRIGDNTTAVDLTGDTKFRYPGIPTGVLGPAAINTRAISAMMPGGLAAGRRWDTQIEFVTQSKFVAMIWVPASATPRILAMVNGKWLAPSFAVSASAGNTSYVMFEFPDRSSRRIKLVFAGGHQVVRFDTESASAPVRPTGNDKCLLAIGDSLTAGTGVPPDAASVLDTWAQGAATLLGFDHCCNAAIGGTMWVAGGAGDVAISHFGGDRLPLALTISPEAVAYAGSRNDAAGNQTQLDAITSAVGTALDATTVTKKFVMGTFTVLAQNAAVQAGAVAKGVPFVDMQQGLQPADIGTDLVHPTYQGAVNLRNRIVPALRAAGCVP